VAENVTLGRLTFAGALAAAIVSLSLPGYAHDESRRRPVIVDTDLGIDDVVAVAMALQDPDLDLAAMVATEGVADAATATDQLGRLASNFNRSDVRLFAAAARQTGEAPPWRPRARAMVNAAVATASPSRVAPAAPNAYCSNGHVTTVVVLGPLTGLAAALSSDPRIAARIGQVVVAGDPEADHDWNLDFDRDAFALVRSAGVPLLFVRRGSSGVKPDGWYTRGLSGGQGTSLGEALLDRLLADPQARDHYLRLEFCDELAVLYLLRPELFTEVRPGIVEPTEGAAAAAAIAASLSRGRQRKDRVVFVNGPLPDAALQPDIRARRAAILANNGPDEWFAALLLNELHEHLGAYSIIGVKMGLRAAELLNAPQHSMQVISRAPATQPLSCLNDGLLVSTGSTPGRALFRVEPAAPGTVEATFLYNGRSLTLRLKEQYRTHIRSTIQGLLAHSSLNDDAYWDGVRELGLEVWQDWHRRDLFEVVASSSPAFEPDEREKL
jgi:pyrimidine-specific ribonucleoside hydrolase